MTMVHTFLDFLPSIFLGAPDEETALSSLPGHRMLLKGLGYEAAKLTAIGCLIGTIAAMILSILFIKTAPIFYPFLDKYMVFILIILSFFLVLTEKGMKSKFFAILIFFLSGTLGYFTLNLTTIKQPLFPLFTGLFGSSLLTISFLKNVRLPEQKITKSKIKKEEIFKALGLSIFSSSLVSFLPGVGSSQAATIASMFKKISEKTFLILLGMINSMTMLLSFVALYAINKPRSGVAVFVGKFLPNISLNQLYSLFIVALIVSIMAFLMTILIAKNFSRFISKINYKKLCLVILIFLIILTPIISGWLGLIVLAVGTSLGIYCSFIGIKKIFLMGSLLLPVIIWAI
jgi:putative membrane protein